MAGKIVYITGPSNSGKDIIYTNLLNIFGDKLTPIITYTCRPIRKGEIDGFTYHYTDVEGMYELEKSGKVIEKRKYDTVEGEWTYATVDDGSFDDKSKTYIGIGTLESLAAIRKFFGADRVIPLYIDVDSDERMQRAVSRERIGHHKYNEMCRRWIQDSVDFSDEKVREANVIRIYNNCELDTAVFQAMKAIISNM